MRRSRHDSLSDRQLRIRTRLMRTLYHTLSMSIGVERAVMSDLIGQGQLHRPQQLPDQAAQLPPFLTLPEGFLRVSAVPIVAAPLTPRCPRRCAAAVRLPPFAQPRRTRLEPSDESPQLARFGTVSPVDRPCRAQP
jgi:hypothetical protein